MEPVRSEFRPTHDRCSVGVPRTTEHCRAARASETLTQPAVSPPCSNPHHALVLPAVSQVTAEGFTQARPQPPALLTLARDIHAEVHAVDDVHVQSPWPHEHGTVAGGLPTTPRVGSFILWPQVCLSLHNAATELCAIVKPPDQDL